VNRLVGRGHLPGELHEGALAGGGDRDGGRGFGAADACHLARREGDRRGDAAADAEPSGPAARQLALVVSRDRRGLAR
jgi:hypothetical protein